MHFKRWSLIALLSLLQLVAACGRQGADEAQTLTINFAHDGSGLEVLLIQGGLDRYRLEYDSATYVIPSSDQAGRIRHGWACDTRSCVDESNPGAYNINVFDAAGNCLGGFGTNLMPCEDNTLSLNCSGGSCTLDGTANGEEFATGGCYEPEAESNSFISTNTQGFANRDPLRGSLCFLRN